MTAKVAESAEEILNGGGEPKLMISDQLVVDGSFPEFTRVFSSHPSPAPDQPSPWTGYFSVAANYLQQVATLAKTLGATNTPVVFGTTDKASPTIISIGGLPNVRVIVMPIRIGAEDEPFVPDWIRPIASDDKSEETVTEKAKRAA